MKQKIVIVDDDRSLRELLAIILRNDGYDVADFDDAEKALAFTKASHGMIDVVVTDIIMPGMDGISFLKQVKQLDPILPVIVITANMRAAYAVEALRQGAHDYITKPFENDEFKIIVRNAAERRCIVRENQQLRQQLEKRDETIVHNSGRIEDLISKAMIAAKSAISVLLVGESGTGKELFARFIHAESPRKDKPFFPINCGAIPETLMESEFFGYERGAFTGASSSKPGYFELADGGTIFLDEIGELPAALQVKLLRVIEERKVMRLGGKDIVPVDVRIMAATNRDLEDEVRKGAFREDLYYRLNVLKLVIPPLRDRAEDILPLATVFMKRFSRSVGKQINGFTRDAIRFLENYQWPGNVRELQNVIERACAYETSELIGVGSLPEELLQSLGDIELLLAQDELPSVPADFSRFSLDAHLHAVERAIVEKAMSIASGNKKEAADMLGVSLWSLYRRLSKLHIERKADGPHD